MIQVLVTAVALVLVFLLWLVLGVLGAIRASVSLRVAAWMLPDGQPLTVRFGQFLAIVAQWLYPRREVRTEVPDFGGLSWVELFWSVERWPSHWMAPRAALAEIAVDLEEERRVIAPVRLTLPLIWVAARERFYNGLNWAFIVVWDILMLPLLVVSFLFGLIVTLTGTLIDPAGARQRWQKERNQWNPGPIDDFFCAARSIAILLGLLCAIISIMPVIVVVGVLGRAIMPDSYLFRDHD